MKLLSLKNKIAVRLTCYFSLVLVMMAIIVGCVFYKLFEENSIDVKRQEMKERASRIAEVLGRNLDRIQESDAEHWTSRSKFLIDLDDTAPEIVWVVNDKRQLTMNIEAMKKARAKAIAEGRRMKFGPLPKTPEQAYRALPGEVKRVVEEAFNGKEFQIERYSDILHGTMITVGAPIYDDYHDIKAVVILHSRVDAVQDATKAGLRTLGISVIVALILGFALSVLFSLRFTKPLKIMKSHAESLAERDYTSRNQITQHDEIGDLSNTLDILAERLQLADEENQKLEKLRKTFIANISHELRTPVTVIRGSLEAIQEGIVTEPEDVAEFHDQMYKESLFLQRLINDLLDLSRLQNEDFPIEKEPLNLCEVVQDAVRSAKQLGKDKALTVSAELDREVYAVNGDYGRLRQMLLIFLHNSIKFSPEGGSIEVLLKGQEIQVVDHGCGIKPEDREHAFERFYKAHNEQNKTGSGLGLAIAQQIAARHDMRLRLESEVGQGTTIVVELPEPMRVEELD